MRVVAIIQARLTSTRLPRKVLKGFRGKTVLQHVIDRVNEVKGIKEVVVASPHKIPFKRAKSFIGDEHDVLQRYYDCANKYMADIIVRITGDCPLIDPQIIRYAIKYFKTHEYPYVCFAPIDGLDVEVFDYEMLDEAWFFTEDKEDREHVTPYMRRGTKLSVDTDKDLERVKQWIGKTR